MRCEYSSHDVPESEILEMTFNTIEHWDGTKLFDVHVTICQDCLRNFVAEQIGFNLDEVVPL